MDKFRIDSHKLMFHVGRVNDWFRGKDIYPVYLEVSPSGACNHRCTYCALDFMGYKPNFLNTKLFKTRISEMARLGIKSVMYAGEGEPLLHRDIADIIKHTKKSGIDVAITTNGVLLNRDLVKDMLSYISWIKVSINAATAKTYAEIHRSKPQDLRMVIDNLKYAVYLRKTKGYNCTLGMQLLLLPENHKEVLRLAKMARDIGIDYLVVKPYSQHPFSRTKKYRNIKYKKYEYLADQLDSFNSDKFSAIFRLHTMKKWDIGVRSYKHCYALPFWGYIDASGNVWACNTYLGKERFRYGDIYKNTFKEVWEGARRKRAVQWASDKLDTSICRVNCRMDEVNRYLWELKHPPEHVNFI